MENCNTIKIIFILTFLNVLWNCTVGHFIQIDHDEFRASGFPRPHLPPALPPIDQLPQHLIVPTKEVTPAELMVDLTNDLTFRVIHYHSILNRNNFAFSPTALMSVLVALYEGSGGRSAIELRNVLQLPGNRDVIRIGYRDIHRRLRTYFFGSDNPLKGLSLNKDNVTILKDYETVLMFYGYDLGVDMVSSTAAPTTQSPGIMDNTTMDGMGGENGTKVDGQTMTSNGSSAEDSSTGKKPSTSNGEESEESESTTAGSTTTDASDISSTTTETAEGSTEAETTAAAPETEGEAAELVSSFVAEEDAEPFLRIQKGRVSRLPSGRLQGPISMPSPLSTPKAKYLPSARSSAPPTRSTRMRRHLLGLKDLDANLFYSLFSSHPSHQNVIPISSTGPTGPTALAHITNDFEVDVDPNFLSTSETKQNYNTDVISHVFYLGNQQIIHTTFKVYNAVLYYKYFESFKMSVLELELDTPEYNLMILLPDFHTDLVTAAASLRVAPTLRLMRKQLKPRWVQAIIPDFKLHGTMFLTNDLQNMGISDVFEPNRADFRPMTEEKSIYVKHIEQSINVNIRTHPINQLKRNYGAQTQPIQISVNHPFLFFIIDRDLDVAVMAGRILNPLNVRIQ